MVRREILRQGFYKNSLVGSVFSFVPRMKHRASFPLTEFQAGGKGVPPAIQLYHTRRHLSSFFLKNFFKDFS